MEAQDQYNQNMQQQAAPFDLATEMLDLVEKHGFSVIPVRRDNKKPYIHWEEYQHRLPTEREIEEWAQRFPGANIAVVTGAISNLVAVDTDGPRGLAWAKEHLPKSSVYVQSGGGTGHWHYLYRHPGVPVQNGVRVVPEVDIRGDGGYIIFPPSIHASGRPYRLYIMEGSNGWDDLPVFPLDVFNLHQAGQGIDLSGVKPLVSLAPVDNGARNDTLARIIGQEIGRGADLQRALIVGYGWNSTLADPLPRKEVENTVKSIMKRHLANHPEAAAAATGGQTIGVDVVPDIRPVALDEIPEKYLHPGGYLDWFMDFTRQQSYLYHPVFALAAGITLLGTLVGGKVCTETKLRTNIFTVCLGLSGSGKNAPSEAIDNIIRHSHNPALLSGNNFTHEAALLKSLEVNPCSMALFDEVGFFMAEANRPTAPQHTLIKLLLELYTGSRKSYRKCYATIDPIIVHWHHFSFCGFSTPSEWWAGASIRAAKNGMFGRCEIFDSRVRGQKNPNRIDDVVPPFLLDATNELIDMPFEWDETQGDLVRIPIPRVIPMTDEAHAFFDVFTEKYESLVQSLEDTDEAASSLYGRIAERAQKFALIHAVSMAGADVHEIGLESVEWACGLQEHLVPHAIEAIRDNLAGSTFESIVNDVYQTIRLQARIHHANVCPLSILRKKVRLPQREFNDAITCLTQSGQIAETTFQWGGKTKSAYIPVKEIIQN